MSNNAPQVFEARAWMTGNAHHYLICWWHVSKQWYKYLNAKIKSNEKRRFVKKSLYTLATKIVNISRSTEFLNSFLKLLLGDKDTIDFHAHFSTLYPHKAEHRVFCYSTHAGLNTNMDFLHRMTKLLHLFRAKTITRFYKTTNTLCKLIRDTMFEQIIKIDKNKPINKVIWLSYVRSE